MKIAGSIKNDTLILYFNGELDHHSAQATREARLAVADDVIDNNGAPDAIASDVARLHAHYLQLASQFVSQEKP